MYEIYHEDVATGAGMTEAQKALRESVAKQQPGIRPRFAMAIQKRYGTTAGLAGLIKPDDLTVSLVYDTQSRRGLRTNGMVCRFTRSPYGLVGIDTRGRFWDRSGDLGLMPRRPVQQGEVVSNQLKLGGGPGIVPENQRRLMAKTTGHLEIRRLGPHLDLCVGESMPGVPLVQYRLSWADFVDGKVSIYPGDDEMLQAAIRGLTSGKSLQLGWTTAGFEHPLAELKAPVSYVEAVLDEQGNPQFASRPYHQLDWDSQFLRIFAALNNANNFSSEVLPPAIPVYVAFRPQVVSELSNDSRFTDSSLEVLDLLGQALSPNGYNGTQLRIQSPRQGRVISILEQDQQIQLGFADGAHLHLPRCAVLSIVEGQVVRAHETIGHYLPPASHYTPDDLVLQLGSFLKTVAVAAIQQLSVLDHGGHYPRLWVPQPLVRNLDSLALQGVVRPGSSATEPLWRLDLSPLKEFYDSSLDAIVLPSLPRTPQDTQYWGSMSFLLFDLERPVRHADSGKPTDKAATEGRPAATKNRPSKKRRDRERRRRAQGPQQQANA